MSKEEKLRTTSANLFLRAKDLHFGFGGKPNPTGFLDVDDEVVDGVSSRVLGNLINPANWSEEVRQAGRKPRVYLETFMNQAGNLEVRWAGGVKQILYASDFDPSFTMGTQRWIVSTSRSEGEVMYVRGFRRLFKGAPRYYEFYKVLLAAYAARLDELVLQLNEAVQLVGYDRIEVVGDQYSIVSSASDERLRSLKDEYSCTVPSRVQHAGFLYPC